MKMSIGAGLAGLAIALSGVPVIGQSQIERQHAAHVHGEATGTLVVDGRLVELELTLPGYNLVGFEHAPRTSEQQAALDSAVAYLSDRAWLNPHTGSSCRVTELYAGTRGFTEAEHRDDTRSGEDDQAAHEHEHDHDHDHEHSEPGSGFDSEHAHDHGPSDGHAEFHVLAKLDCASPQGLDWIELDLFERFPGNEVLVLDVLTDQLAARTRLRAGSERVELRADR